MKFPFSSALNDKEHIPEPNQVDEAVSEATESLLQPPDTNLTSVLELLV